MQDLKSIGKESYPKVSVIIPTYKDFHCLPECLKRLSEQTYPAEAFEVIVVNNDPDNPLELSPKVKNFTILSEKKAGSYAARNTGLDHAGGDIIAFTDADCLPDPDWVENAVNHIRSGEVRVAGKVCLFYQSDNLSIAEIYEKAFAFNQYKNVMRGCAVTANLIVLKTLIDNVGGFNEELLSGGDFEWNKRATEDGISILYAEDVKVWHPARATIRELKKKVIRTARSGHDPYLQNSGSVIDQVLSLFRSLMPPIKAYKELHSRHDMSLREKLIAGILAYYLKLYTTYQRFLTNLGVTEKVRA
jgi:GT2 family glycosyltransferase